MVRTTETLSMSSFEVPIFDRHEQGKALRACHMQGEARDAVQCAGPPPTANDSPTQMPVMPSLGKPPRANLTLRERTSTHPSCRRAQSGWLRASQSTSAPARSKLIQSRLRLFSDLQTDRAEARASQQALVS